MNDPQIPAVRVQTQYHRRTLDVRAIDRIVQDSLFAEAWQYATTAQRSEVLRAMGYADTSAVKNWVSKIMVGVLDRCNMTILKDLAREHKIAGYSRLTKAQLVDQLTRKGANYVG